MSTRRRLREIYRALDRARSYQDWLQAAADYDRLTGLDEWRAEDDSIYYDAAVLRADTRSLRTLREGQRAEELADLLTHSIYRHTADISAPELYGQALTGTKHLVESYLDQIEAALSWLAHHRIPGVTSGEKRARFAQGWKVFGRTALLLSGGATWGFHHLGVVKALFEHGLLPHILSGASTGAMVAAGVCTRTDLELADLFANTDQMRLDGLKPAGLRRSLSDRAWLAPEQLLEVLHHNVGDRTFEEAWQHSGRILAIPVSPTRTRQRARLLDRFTAPDVLVAWAALASSALPGLFPPVELRARGADGQEQPFVKGERWVDGSITADLPKRGLMRLHNVNHFIVSQTNPHVLPFVRHHGRDGLAPAALGLTGALVRTQGATLTGVARRITAPHDSTIGRLADRGYALATQDYGGDIDLHPRFRPTLFSKVFANPSRADLAAFIAEGQASVWPKLAMIRDQTRIGRAFRASLDVVGAGQRATDMVPAKSPSAETGG